MSMNAMMGETSGGSHMTGSAARSGLTSDVSSAGASDNGFSPDYQTNFLKPLVSGWLGRIEKCKEARSHWKRQADECMHFYESSASFMQEAAGNYKFWEGVTQPNFRITIAKAFELVAQIGPSLFFRAPRRKVTPRRMDEVPQQIFGDVENDPQAQQMYQQYQQESQLQAQSDVARAKLMETWLNYTPKVTPGGGMEEHVERAIIEALIKGRGVLWPEPYQMPGSEQVLTGLFYDTVDNLLIDPDCEKLEDANFIVRTRVEHYRKVEKRFDLPKNSLKDKATLFSASQNDRTSNTQTSKSSRWDPRTDDISRDYVIYYEVFSKFGIGADYSGLDEKIADQMEAVAGEYVYLAVSPSVDYPLNLPTKIMFDGATDEIVKAALEWPIPYWSDNQFPCVVLDFYPRPRSPWPMPPLAPGMGELKFLNIIISHLCNRIWMSSRDFIAVAKSAQKEVEKILEEGKDLSIIPVSDVHKNIGEMIQFLQQPQVNFDVWQIVDRVSEMFDKRVGLTDLVYGLTNTQSRSAEDAATKKAGISARPDHMARKVEKFMARASSMEAFCTRWFVDAKDVKPLVGETASQLWSMLIDSQDIEMVVREMEYDVVAGSGRRRDYESELSNINQALQFFFPEFSKSADMTTDVTAVNQLIQRWGDAAQIDMSDVELPPRMPPQQEGPSPEEQQAQMEMEMKQQEFQMDMQTKQAELQIKQAEAQMKAAGEQGKIQADQVKAMMDLEATKIEAEQKSEQSESETEMKASDNLLDMLFNSQVHAQDMKQDQEVHVQEMAQKKEEATLQRKLALAGSRESGSSNGSSSNGSKK